MPPLPERFDDGKTKDQHTKYLAEMLFIITRNFSRLRRLNFLFMGNMSPYYLKTIFTLSMKCMPSFIKIGGAVSEKNGKTRHTFVVLYIGSPRI